MLYCGPPRKGAYMRQVCQHGLNWCGRCYELVKGKVSKHRSHHYTFAPRRSRGSMGIQRPDKGAGNAGGPVKTDESPIAVGHPVLWEHLTATSYEDGGNRQPSSLLLFVEDGKCKLCLNDRDASRTGWITGATVEEALIAMELALGAGRMDWRASRPAPQRRR